LYCFSLLTSHFSLLSSQTYNNFLFYFFFFCFIMVLAICSFSTF
jgi:hypothetical protein